MKTTKNRRFTKCDNGVGVTGFIPMCRYQTRNQKYKSRQFGRKLNDSYSYKWLLLKNITQRTIAELEDRLEAAYQARNCECDEVMDVSHSDLSNIMIELCN
jgi:hypothetical protein